jgi:hypothetical protein
VLLTSVGHPHHRNQLSLFRDPVSEISSRNSLAFPDEFPDVTHQIREGHHPYRGGGRDKRKPDQIGRLLGAKDSTFASAKDIQ